MDSLFQKIRKIYEAPLSTEEREELDSKEFAVPSKRKLPINDKEHVKLAWDMVDRTEGLTDKEREEARKRILAKAKELGVDTSDWNVEKEEKKDESYTYFNVLSTLGVDVTSSVISKLIEEGVDPKQAISSFRLFLESKVPANKAASFLKEARESYPEASSDYEAIVAKISEDIMSAITGDPAPSLNSFDSITQPSDIGPFMRAGVGGEPENEDKLSAEDQRTLLDLLTREHELMDNYRKLAKKTKVSSLKGHLNKELDRRSDYVDNLAKLFDVDMN